MNRLLLLFGLIMTMACETVVYYDIALENPSIVLNSVINPDSTIKVKLTESKYILDVNWEFTAIPNAEVMLYENNTLIGQIPYTDMGYYILDNGFLASAGNEYRIEVNKTGFVSVKTNSVIPAKDPVIQILDIQKIREDEWNSYLEYTVNITDPPGNNNYILEYYAYTYQYLDWNDPSTIYDSTLQKVYIETEDPILTSDNDYYYENLLFTDQLFEGKSAIVKFKVGFWQFPEPDRSSSVMILKNLNDDYYLYLKSNALQMSTQGDPFAEPVPVYNNIENGYGIFGGYTQTQKDTTYFFPP